MERELAFYIDKPVAEGVTWLARSWVLSCKSKLDRTGTPKIEMWVQSVPAITLPPEGWGTAYGVSTAGL